MIDEDQEKLYKTVLDAAKKELKTLKKTRTFSYFYKIIKITTSMYSSSIIKRSWRIQNRI